MNIEQFRDICLAVKGATECMPYGDGDTLVFKVMNKVFVEIGLTPKDGRLPANLKCDPERSVALREQYSGIDWPIHAPKTLKWNSVDIQGDVPDDVIRELVSHSVEEVIKNITRKKREEYING